MGPYPTANMADIDHEAERQMAAIIDIVHQVRNVRAQHQVAATRLIEAQIYAGKLKSAITAHAKTIERLAKAKTAVFGEKRQPPAENDLVLVLKDTEVVIPLESMVDLQAERQRLGQEIKQMKSDVGRLEARLRDKTFLSKAPAAVVDKERARLAERRDKLEKLTEQKRPPPGLTTAPPSAGRDKKRGRRR